jgi:hypothetical protein
MLESTRIALISLRVLLFIPIFAGRKVPKASSIMVVVNEDCLAYGMIWWGGLLSSYGWSLLPTHCCWVSTLTSRAPRWRDVTPAHYPAGSIGGSDVGGGEETGPNNNRVPQVIFRGAVDDGMALLAIVSPVPLIIPREDVVAELILMVNPLYQVMSVAMLN